MVGRMYVWSYQDVRIYAPVSVSGEAYSKAGQAAEAQKWYAESLRSKPDHIPVHLTLAKHLAKLGRDDEAEQWFKKAHALNRADPAVWTHYGEDQHSCIFELEYSRTLAFPPLRWSCSSSHKIS